jgi:hypothetical protein
MEKKDKKKERLQVINLSTTSTDKIPLKIKKQKTVASD